MATGTLAETWVYAGQRYGPGEVSLPDDVHAALQAKGAFGEQSPADPLVEAVGATGAQALRDMGFGDLAAIAAASDDDLMAVPGIGAATLAKLRALGEG